MIIFIITVAPHIKHREWSLQEHPSLTDHLQHQVAPNSSSLRGGPSWGVPLYHSYNHNNNNNREFIQCFPRLKEKLCSDQYLSCPLFQWHNCIPTISLSLPLSHTHTHVHAHIHTHGNTHTRACAHACTHTHIHTMDESMITPYSINVYHKYVKL